MSKKGENIYKRKDNRWEARYIKEHRADGTVKFGYCYGKTYKEAKQKLIEAMVNTACGRQTEVIKCKKVISHYCDEWLTLKKNQIKESTFVKYTTILENHIKPQIGNYTIHNISSTTIEAFGNYLLEGKKLSVKTVKDILSVLNSIFKHINKQTPNIVQNMEIFCPKKQKKEVRVLSLEEQELLMNYLLTDMNNYKFGALLALITGMRIGEICALKWENVSLREKTVRVCSTMQRLRNFEDDVPSKTKIVISEPKSWNSSRVIPLTDFAVELCKKYYSDNSQAFVLTGKADRYVEPRILQQKFAVYTSALGLKGVHFHTLRHTFATRCVEVDFEIKTLSEILGHSNPHVTLERYVHSSFRLKRSNMDKLAAIGF